MTQQDLQTLDRDYFWNVRPKVVINELKRYFDKVVDITDISDEPRLKINGLYYVYLPTSIKETMYQTNCYTLIRESDDEVGNIDLGVFTQDLDELIEEINTMIDNDKTMKESDVAHRMRMIMDDLMVIRKQFNEAQLQTPTALASSIETHFLNIEIACDLDSSECYNWELYSKTNNHDINRESR
jgi:hypothetical protein